MANNLAKNYTADQIRDDVLPMYDDSQVTMKTVDRDSFPAGTLNNKTGDNIFQKRPHQYVTTETPKGDLSGVAANDITAATAELRAQDMLSVHVEMEEWEQAFQLNQQDRVLRPIMTKLATDEEVRLNSFMKDNLAHTLGTVGSPINSWDDISEVDAFAKSIALPRESTYVQISPYGIKGLAQAQTGLAADGKVRTAWDTAMIGTTFAGSHVYGSSLLANQVNGDYGAGTGIQVASAPTQTYLAAKDTYQTSIPLKGLALSTTGVLKKGDRLEVAGRNWNQMQSKQRANANGDPITYKCVVSADINSDGGGLATVVVNGPAIFETDGQYNTIDSLIATDDNVNILSGTANAVTTPNLWYIKSAIAISPIDIKPLYSKDSASASANGISIRVTKDADFLGNMNMIRFDSRYAYGCMNPLWGGVVGGQ